MSHIPTHASYLADVARAAHQTGKDLTLDDVAAVIEAVNSLGAADDTLARTGNTARDQEMYVAGIRTGEENAKNNAAIRAGAGWLPIESAPKDGTMILLGREAIEDCDAISVPGFWQEGWEDSIDDMGCDSGFVDVHFQEFSGGRSFGAEAYRCAPNQPTHWMPLPAAPGVSTVEDERQAFEAWFARRGVWPALCFEEVFIAGWNARAAPAPAAGNALERQYTSAMGVAGQRYMDRFPYAHALPAEFRWEDLWNTMQSAASPASDTARDADVSALLAFIFERFGQPGDAGDLPDSVVAAVRRLERAAIAAQRKGDA